MTSRDGRTPRVPLKYLDVPFLYGPLRSLWSDNGAQRSFWQLPCRAEVSGHDTRASTPSPAADVGRLRLQSAQSRRRCGQSVAAQMWAESMSAHKLVAASLRSAYLVAASGGSRRRLHVSGHSRLRHGLRRNRQAVVYQRHRGTWRALLSSMPSAYPEQILPRTVRIMRSTVRMMRRTVRIRD
jgi:hypothetical protein